MQSPDPVSLIVENKRGDRPVIGCFPLYPPVELFASMGLLPVTLWNLKTTVRDLTESDKHVQNYACGIARELIQFVLSETGGLLDGIYSYNACDTLRNTPEILAAALSDASRDIPMLRLHVPQVNRAQTNPEHYLKNEIATLTDVTEKTFQVRFSPEMFLQTIESYATMRALCMEAEALVARGALSFGIFCRAILSGYFLPVDVQIKHLSALIAAADHDKIDRPTKGVIVSGIMPPPAAVSDAMEASRLRVVGNDIASMHRSYAYSPHKTPDPGDYYVDLFNNRFPCTTLLYQTDTRLERFLDMVTRTGARGVIFSGEKFCEYEYFEFPYLEKRLKEIGLPTLFLEFSVDDAENVSAYKTRVEAFSEMIEQ